MAAVSLAAADHRLADEPELAPLAFAWARDVAFAAALADELIEDVLTAGGMSAWIGAPGSGKTTLLADALMRMPHAQPWLGKRTERASTLLVAAESPRSSLRRLHAYRSHHGLELDIGGFAIVPTSPVLLAGHVDVDRLIDAVLRATEEAVSPVRLVAIDTVARVMTGAKEDDEGMGRLITAGDRIRCETGAHIAFVHHVGKDPLRGARGHSSFLGAIDTEITIEADPGTKLRTLRVTKQRDMEDGLEFTARFLPVDLGLTNNWGKPITSCVVEHVEPESPRMQALLDGADRHRAEQIVLAGFPKLLAQGVKPTDGETSPDYLPKRLAEKGLHDGFERKELAAAMHRLMTAGVLRRDVIGTYGNRSTPKYGLVLV